MQGELYQLALGQESSLWPVVATFLLVNNVIKRKDTTETEEVEVILMAVPWVSWGDLRHATSVFFVLFFFCPLVDL